MKADIYYFSATGNSLTTANMLAEYLGDGSRCIPIASLRDAEIIDVTATNVGFVFPVYYGDMPYIVRLAVEHMAFHGTEYIFSLCTYRGHMGDVGGRLDALLRTRGQSLSLSLGVSLPGNSRISSPEETEALLAAQRENVRAASRRIAAMERTDCSCAKALEPTLVSYPHNFRGLTADTWCTGCGVCARICPMDNIRISRGQAIIGDNCITCLACFHWCPVEAIYMSLDESIARRAKYRHPDVSSYNIAAQKVGQDGKA